MCICAYVCMYICICRGINQTFFSLCLFICLFVHLAGCLAALQPMLFQSPFDSLKELKSRRHALPRPLWTQYQRYHTHTQRSFFTKLCTPRHQPTHLTIMQLSTYACTYSYTSVVWSSSHLSDTVQPTTTLPPPFDVDVKLAHVPSTPYPTGGGEEGTGCCLPAEGDAWKSHTD